MARPPKPPDPAERQRIVAAASELMGEVGPASTKLAEVATRAGVAYGTIYRHFPDRNALLLEALLDQTRQVVELWDGAALTKDPVERIIAICSIPFEHAMNVPGLPMAFSGSAAIDGAQAETARMFSLGESYVKKAIAQAKRAGKFKGLPSDVLAHMLLGGPNSYLTLNIDAPHRDWHDVERGIAAVVRKLAG
jgi:AcrR family transcriptional regulator